MKAIKCHEDIYKITKKVRMQSHKYELLIKIGIYSGLRVSDILDLRVGDVKYCEVDGEAGGKIRLVENKTKKVKEIVLDKEIYHYICDYMLLNRLKLSDYLVYSCESRKNRSLSRVQAYRVIKRASMAMGLNDIGTHSLRKTYALNEFRKHGDIKVLQAKMNHKYESTTWQYILTGIDLDKLKQTEE